MIFGDVLAALALICGIPLTTWAMVIAARLLFPELCERSANRLINAPGASFGVGVLITLVGVVFAIVLLNVHNPIARFLGADVASFLLSLSIIGCAGLGTIAGRRIQSHDERISGYAAYVRGSAFVIVACMSPLVGWFFILPIALITSVGAGYSALVRRASSAAIA